MAQQIVVFKLISGEEVIGRMGEKKDDRIFLEKPRAVAVTQGQQPGQMGIALVPFLASNPDGDIAILETHIMATAVPTPELENGYIQQTTGIALATK